jgi:uncharacterized membrane protein
VSDPGAGLCAVRTSRLEAFSDGVLAILITILVLELEAPHVSGLVLLMTAIAYWILLRAILAREGHDSLLARAVGRDLKGKISPVLYLVAVPAAFRWPWIAGALYVVVALLWPVPDRCIERALAARGGERAWPPGTPHPSEFPGAPVAGVTWCPA